MISGFRGPNNFLSNFFECDITYNGITYKNTEAAFQAQKTKVRELQEKFANLDPSAAKRKGRGLYLRTDWEEVKDNLMYEIVKAKFEQNPALLRSLLATGEVELVEANIWHDNYWGVCECEKCKDIQGKNNLGKVLMRVREELRERA